MAPANQLRLSFAGSEDGEAETETCRAAKPLWRTTTRNLTGGTALLHDGPEDRGDVSQNAGKIFSGGAAAVRQPGRFCGRDGDGRRIEASGKRVDA